jgi:hypothetical protein
MLARSLLFAPLPLFTLTTLAHAQKVRADDVPRPETCFDGDGGPTGDFDWYVRTGEVFFFDTTLTMVVGGPNGLPTTIQNAANGIVNVRDLVIEEGGEIRAQGPNPLRILAQRDVVVRGRLNVSGFNARDVATLNTGNQTEPGASGGPGGGRGGNANVVITNSSPRGGSGHGPGTHVNQGGQGGETGYSPAGSGKDTRRPGGGGGGRFAADGTGTGEQAQSGGDGHALSSGAESGESPAAGGLPGAGAFSDGTMRNDFFGEGPLIGAPGHHHYGRLRGELDELMGGFGGGGGGNADPAATFPTPGWNFASDEKGGAGGGGGGIVHVQALGRIVFGAAGEIRADGGRGGTGENTNFLDHVGGSGGSGSGGHVVLEAAGEIDFTDGGTNRAAAGRDWIHALGGARVVGPTQFNPPDVAPLSNGGAGGPGVVQLHVREPLRAPDVLAARTDIVVPFAVAFSADPLDAVAAPAAWALYPTCPLAPLPLTHGRGPGSTAVASGAPGDVGSSRFDPLARLLRFDPTRLGLPLGF